MRRLFHLISICLLVWQISANNSAACGTGASTITNLPSLGGSSYAAYGLNRAGQITGYSYLPGDLAAHAFLYSNGQTADLGTLGSDFSQAWAINASGQVAAESGTAGGLETHA